MNTKILKLSEVNVAAKIIRDNGLVAFPTETVYGLGANGLNDFAVKKIFVAKGRPQDNPLILHVSKIEQVKPLVIEIPLNAKKLMNKFWPGPLTIIMKKSNLVPNSVTCGLDSVAIRMPKNSFALKLITKSKCPIAAPSANISGKPSPTEFKHVMLDLFGKIDAIVEGDKTNIGIESTVIDITQKIPLILRPGVITKKQIEKVIGSVVEHTVVKGKKIIAKSPGMKYRHYAPRAKIVLFDCKNCSSKIIKNIKNKRVGIICLNKSNIMKFNKYAVKCIYVGDTPKLIAKNLFSSFRKFDELGVDLICVEQFGNTPEWSGVRNRLYKAASQIIR